MSLPRRRCGRFAGAIAAVLVAAIGLGGCAAPQSAALRESLASAAAGAKRLPAHARLDVPFVAQTEYQCGPASLAMVLGAAGRPVALEPLIEAVYLPARRGSLQAEMLAQPRREGMLSVRLEPRLDSVLRIVADGTPVLVFQNLGLSWAPVWHYAVLVGYDLPAGQVVLHSGTHESMPMSLDTFERTWARTGHWAMIATDPSRIPETVALGDALRAAVALERLDRPAAMHAYDALRSRAPRDRLVQFARANALLADQRPAAAAAAYRELLATHDEFADGWNNLAHALADLGEFDAAQAAAERAVSLGGPSIAVYRQTAARMHSKAASHTQ